MSAAQQLPSALRNRRAAIEAEGGIPNPDGSLSPVVPAEPSVPLVPAEPAPTTIDPKAFEVPTDISSTVPPAPAPVVQLPSEDFEQKWRSAQGILRARDEEIRALKDALTVKAAAPPPAPVAPQPAVAVTSLTLPTLPEITPEQAAKYENSIPIIRRLAADLIGQAMAPVLARLQAVEELSGRVTDTQKAVVGLAAQTFQTTLYNTVPDLAALSRTPEFKEWMNTTLVPYGGGQTVRQRLKDAYDSEDVSTIAEIVKDYRKQKGVAPQPADPAKFSQPPTGGGAAPQPEETAAKPMLAWSKRQEASLKFRKRQMSAAEFQQIEQLYTAAIAENRVDYGK